MLWSKRAPSSVRNFSQRSAARSKSAPVATKRRPRRYSTVLASAAIIPARAPASIDMLLTVIRSSIESASIASPRYSMTCPVPPSVVMRPIMPRIKSLAVTPGLSRPSTRISSVFGLACHRHCVASTCSTSLVPTPKASEPNAPWVAVWLSPHTMVIPGWVRPNSGPMTCTMPCSGAPRSNRRTPNSRQLLRIISICAAESGSAIGLVRSVVGTL